MKIILSITKNYRPNWDTWCGIRELVQNSRDAEVEFSAPFSCSYNKKNRTLTLVNTGCTLSHESLLLGETTKKDKPDLIGQWGDGLKIGVLALLREGKLVHIRTGNEVWQFVFEHSPEYKTTVLVVKIRTVKTFRNVVEVEVVGLSPSEWEDLAPRFRWLPGMKDASTEVINSSYGSLLCDRPGKIYSRGIWVEDNPSLLYGYDFLDIPLNIDRCRVDSYCLEEGCRRVISSSIEVNPNLIPMFYQMILSDSADIRGFEYWTPSPTIASSLKKEWVKQYGENTIPLAPGEVSSTHSGIIGIPTNRVAQCVLGKVVGTLESAKKRLKFSIKKEYSLNELQPRELRDLSEVLYFLKDVGYEIDQGILKIVEFRHDDILGLASNGKLQVARKVLSMGIGNLLITITHELVHLLDKNLDLHELLEEKILGKVLNKQFRRVSF